MKSSLHPLDPKHRTAAHEEEGTLWVVAVPIGNLEDITLRAIRLLESVDLIACEDTRVTRQLLRLLNLKIPTLLSCHEHNEVHRSEQIIRHLKTKRDVVLVSDAGTPNISDPGFRLLRAVIDAGCSVSPIPGACAAISALSVCGLPTNRFRFIGFLSSKESARRKALEELKEAEETLIFYESPHRLDRFLKDASSILGEERPAVIARELTKHYEEFRRGTLSELCVASGVNRGEIVILIQGKDQRAVTLDLNALVDEVIALNLSPSASAKELKRRSHLSRREAYELLRTHKS